MYFFFHFFHFFHFFIFFIFSFFHCSSFFSFFIFSFFSCFHFFIFFIFLSFFLFVVLFSSFFFMFLLFASLFLLLFWVARNPIFFGLNCSKISCSIKKNFEPSRGAPLWALFSFFCSCPIKKKKLFLFSKNFFFFHFSQKKSFFFFFFLEFLSNKFNCWRSYQSLPVSSVVGAPRRCGVLTTQGGIAGIGLGRLLEREHASTPQSGVEAPRLLKRSLPRLYFCCSTQ